MELKKITPISAILISVNIIVGAGIYINMNKLAVCTGVWGGLIYWLGALILLPIVLCLAELAMHNPMPGGMYVYARKYLHPMVGFMSGWSYFMAKATSVALLVHVFVSFFEEMIPSLSVYTSSYLSLGVIALLIFLNSCGVTIGGIIQYFFATMKFIPILFIMIAAWNCFNPQNISWVWQDSFEIGAALPLVVFALLSFEVVCSIGHLVSEPKKIRFIILMAFGLVSFLYGILQFLMFGSLGYFLGVSSKPVMTLGIIAFPQFEYLTYLVNGLIFTSVIAGAFGVLTSNCWNLFALAKDKLLPGNQYFMFLTKKNIPLVCLLIEGMISGCILMISSDLIALQNMAVFCVCITYFLNCCAAFIAVQQDKTIALSIWIPAMALVSSFYLMFLCTKKLWGSGLSFAFLSLFLFGIIAFLWQELTKKKEETF